MVILLLHLLYKGKSITIWKHDILDEEIRHFLLEGSPCLSYRFEALCFIPGEGQILDDTVSYDFMVFYYIN